LSSAIDSSTDVSSRIGLNTNLTVADREYHVQTEDLGLQRTCIVTHVFAKNGQVVLKLRFDYGKYVGHPNLGSIVPRAMQAQHVSVMQKLRREGEPSVAVSHTDLPCVPETTPSPDLPPSEPAQRRPRLQSGVWDRLVAQAKSEREREHTQAPTIALPEPTPEPSPNIGGSSTAEAEPKELRSEEALVLLCQAVEREPKNRTYRARLLRVLRRLGNG
jgi:hypothetical protein